MNGLTPSGWVIAFLALVNVISVLAAVVRRNGSANVIPAAIFVAWLAWLLTP